MVSGRTLPIGGLPANLQDSVDAYGERRIDFPQWFFGDTYAVAEAWLERLSQPLDVITLPMYRQQRTGVRGIEVDQVRPGRVFDLRVTDPNTLRAVAIKAICLGVTLSDSRDTAAQRTAYFVGLADAEPLPVLRWGVGKWGESVWG